MARFTVTFHFQILYLDLQTTGKNVEFELPNHLKLNNIFVRFEIKICFESKKTKANKTKTKQIKLVNLESFKTGDLKISQVFSHQLPKRIPQATQHLKISFRTGNKMISNAVCCTSSC